MKVWTGTSVEPYNGDILWGVYASRQVAVSAIKRDYGPPYIVAWKQKRVTGGWLLIGEFEAVLGKSTKHTGCFQLVEHEVIS